jgi:PAS domain-containing protein
MPKGLFTNGNYLKTIIDAIPSAIFVVSHDYKILDLNPAAADMFGMDSDIKLHRLCGEIFHCFYEKESEKGCGTTQYCTDCVIRNSVNEACKGNCVHKEKHHMLIAKHEIKSDIDMLVTAAPFDFEKDRYVLLTLEDITEIGKLRRLLPICASCKKIRNDEDYWEEVSNYLYKYASIGFTHCLCPECVKKLYPDHTS